MAAFEDGFARIAIQLAVINADAGDIVPCPRRGIAAGFRSE
jgi:hypothetical protein